ncbi:hypothetical protein E7T09_18695 [Deinococcus sp. KSM4-11]|uniref:hypothetical protein n=1 Tax=Deinococcus sp. KSM4-11 TaxID=2568654 RepID=UPI0010A51131|nr:hypothetical protein [Deinococcus sp. KSM4-11]THF85067.1 hypothetical protein E7T09_18695 [Deinococcus sp. KSM4-11]
MIPITEDVSDGFPGYEAPSSLEAWFTYLHGPLEELIGQLSHSGSVAYVELEYFGGTGDQAAAVWQHGHRTWGPEKARIGPVNQALALLGSIREPGQDEFEAVGLNQHRHLEDWLE